jgi:hypothetical protein
MKQDIAYSRRESLAVSDTPANMLFLYQRPQGVSKHSLDESEPKLPTADYHRVVSEVI